jgi:hypothetical protein
MQPNQHLQASKKNQIIVGSQMYRLDTEKLLEALQKIADE